MDMIEIKLTKQRLLLTESEIIALLAKNPTIWKTAIKRGKGLQRHMGIQSREMKISEGREVK